MKDQRDEHARRHGQPPGAGHQAAIDQEAQNNRGHETTTSRASAIRRSRSVQQLERPVPLAQSAAIDGMQVDWFTATASPWILQPRRACPFVESKVTTLAERRRSLKVAGVHRRTSAAVHPA